MAEKIVKIYDGLLEETLAAAYAPVVTISELVKNSSDACHNKKDIIRIDINTSNNTVTVKDNGIGFSAKDFEDLGDVGHSNKMTDGNQLSRIGEPYAGSKGLGILTAFNICERIELLTYSECDKISYQMHWDKGTERIIYAPYVDGELSGTELKLVGVSKENMRLITMNDELSKLYSSSINYYIDSESLPIIEVYEDGIKKHSPQKVKIEQLYQKHKEFKGKGKGFFIAKGTFAYLDNKLTLSYEDNYKNLFNFSDQVIDLTDLDSINTFLFQHDIDFKSVVYRNALDMWKNFDSSTYLDSFSGVYYIWRERKDDNIHYPHGVRIYVNNYGLYDYLNTENDWLSHSEISQNISASNYKLKNTYGYVRFDMFNETRSGLKISKERNDFIVNLSQKKFLYIMQGFVSGIFSSIDITLKDKKYKRYVFQLRYDNRRMFVGDNFNIKEMLYTTLPLRNVTIEHDDSVKIDLENGNVSISAVGKHNIRFSDGSEWLEAVVNVEDPTPSFELTQNSIKKLQGETIELRGFINKGSIVNIPVDDIQIVSETALIKNGTFSPQNYPGEYAIQYIYEPNDDLVVSHILKAKIEPLYISDSNKFQRIFPFYKALNDYIKIKEIIDEISKCYKQYPNVSIIALRTLMEVSLRAFLGGVCGKTVNDKIAVDQAIGWAIDEVYQNNSLIESTVLGKYRDRLLSGRKRLIKDYIKLELNTYVHDCDALPTSHEVLQATKRFSMFLNFIIESLVARQNRFLP